MLYMFVLQSLILCLVLRGVKVHGMNAKFQLLKVVADIDDEDPAYSSQNSRCSSLQHQKSYYSLKIYIGLDDLIWKMYIYRSNLFDYGTFTADTDFTDNHASDSNVLVESYSGNPVLTNLSSFSKGTIYMELSIWIAQEEIDVNYCNWYMFGCSTKRTTCSTSHNVTLYYPHLKCMELQYVSFNTTSLFASDAGKIKTVPLEFNYRSCGGDPSASVPAVISAQIQLCTFNCSVVVPPSTLPSTRSIDTATPTTNVSSSGSVKTSPSTFETTTSPTFPCLCSTSVFATTIVSLESGRLNTVCTILLVFVLIEAAGIIGLVGWICWPKMKNWKHGADDIRSSDIPMTSQRMEATSQQMSTVAHNPIYVASSVDDKGKPPVAVGSTAYNEVYGHHAR